MLRGGSGKIYTEIVTRSLLIDKSSFEKCGIVVSRCILFIVPKSEC